MYWLEHISATARPTVSKMKQEVGHCDAYLIRRDQMRHSSLVEMETQTSCPGIAQLGFDIFDRYGRLTTEYYEHAFRKGSGVWGRELDRVDILFIRSILVDKEWRRHSVATALLRAVLNKMKRKVSRETGSLPS